MKLPILSDPFKDADGASLQVGSIDVFNGWFDDTGAFRRRPGLQPWFGEGAMHAVDALYWWEHKASLVVVSGGRLLRFTDPSLPPSYGMPTAASHLGGVNAVSVADGGRWLMAVSGGMITMWDGESGSAQFLGGLFPASHVAWLNGKFVATDLAQGVVRFTDYLGTEATTAPVFTGEYFAAEGSPDAIKALAVQDNELLLIGAKTTEYWYDSGEFPVPFARSSGGHLNVGISAVFSLVRDRDSLFWLTDRWQVVQVAGHNITVLSSPIEKYLRGLPNLEQARMFRIDHWLVLTIPGVETLACNLKTGGWSKWTWTNPRTLVEEEWLGRCAAYVDRWNRHFVGTRLHSVIAISSESCTQDIGATISTRILGARLDRGSIRRKRAWSITARLNRGA